MIRAAIVTALLVAPVHADIYRYKDESGRVWLTSQPKQPSVAEIIKAVKQSVPSTPASVSRKDINSIVHEASLKYKVEERLIHAVIKTESTYRKSAVSNKGAVGLMQLMPDTATRFGVSDRQDVKQNIEGGVKFLKFLLDTFKDTKLAIAGYNAGEHAVMRHNNQIPPYPETQNYVGLVMSAYQER
jgi:soluble lytic murein transglycosylase-like protein